MKTIKLSLGVSALSLLVACGSETGDSSGAGPEIEAIAEVVPSITFSSQADTGAQAYATNCAACHGAERQGSALGPMLSGGGFVNSWGRQSPSNFFIYLKANMPPATVPVPGNFIIMMIMMLMMMWWWMMMMMMVRMMMMISAWRGQGGDNNR